MLPQKVARRPEADHTFPPHGRLVVLSSEQVREYAGARCAAHFVLGGPRRGLVIRQRIETNVGQASTPAHDGGMHGAEVFIGGDQQNELETLADVAGFGSPEWRGPTL